LPQRDTAHADSRRSAKAQREEGEVSMKVRPETLRDILDAALGLVVSFAIGSICGLVAIYVLLT
jgi:hypothetical protein